MLVQRLDDADAGIVHEHVDPPERVERGPRELDRRLFVAYVAADVAEAPTSADPSNSAGGSERSTATTPAMSESRNFRTVANPIPTPRQ